MEVKQFAPSIMQIAQEIVGAQPVADMIAMVVGLFAATALGGYFFRHHSRKGKGPVGAER